MKAFSAESLMVTKCPPSERACISAAYQPIVVSVTVYAWPLKTRTSRFSPLMFVETSLLKFTVKLSRIPKLVLPPTGNVTEAMLAAVVSVTSMFNRYWEKMLEGRILGSVGIQNGLPCIDPLLPPAEASTEEMPEPSSNRQ